jgi:hypothetical protein
VRTQLAPAGAGQHDEREEHSPLIVFGLGPGEEGSDLVGPRDAEGGLDLLGRLGPRSAGFRSSQPQRTACRGRQKARRGGAGYWPARGDGASPPRWRAAGRARRGGGP